MASKLKVAVAGATGETGQSIMDALLAKPEQYEVYALSRPASANKPVLVAYAGRGAIIKSVDFGSNDALVAALTGIHVVISCLLVLQDKEQNAIVEASIQAKVQRYVPGFFGPACPARGVMKVRELKENLLDHIKRLYLPYTVIDFGWWYQLGLPPLPSGRVQSKFEYALPEIMGDGEVPFALIDKRDIGEYVARVIVDPRTLNKMVFGYGEVWKQNDIFDALEEISGEKIVRQRLTEKDMKNIVSSAYQMMASQTNVTDYTTMVEKNLEIMTKAGLTEYKYSMGIRGDNTPEHAKYLGYLDAKELYPDMETIGLKAFMREMLEGKIRAVYSAA